jgi:hypothetical protein
MRNLFLAPRSNETAYKNYISSMQGIPRSTIEPYLTASEMAQLGDKKFFHIWGCQPSLEKRWDQMSLGDYVMFYARGKFISVGKLSFKKKSDGLALALWPKSNDSHEPWSCVFFVESLEEVDLPIGDFASMTGYNIDRVQGFMPVKSGLQKIIDRYGSVDNFVDAIVSGLNYSDVGELSMLASKTASFSPEEVAKFDELTRDKDEKRLEEALKQHAASALGKKPEQVTKQVTSFKRNRKLVNDIKEKFDNKCQICGFTFKTGSGSYYSEAAHVVPISSGKEGVDSPDNIWVLCANHHKMLDLHALDAIGPDQYQVNGEVKKLLTS